MKIQKKIGGRGVGWGGRVGGGGVRVDVNEDLKILGKFKKKNGGGGSGDLVGGVRVDVNEELKFVWGGGIGGMVLCGGRGEVCQGGCE